ncbi:cuticle protein 10.9-like [Varroa jacobsoni]|uniref:cuticle protein 10.9-like n=1 Tax=Varroa jacobsoni TaxID=62625 RepID=UPI000BF9135F|nr:cuticle protein 10.9-like [Varroa jacobsoni]
MIYFQLAVVASVSLGMTAAGLLEGAHGEAEVAGHGAIYADDSGYAEQEHYAPQPYKFGYKVNEEWGQQHREEHADGHGNVVGSYGFTDVHGTYRQVNYVADKNGFRAQIKTNEPGTAPSAPADTHIESHAAQHASHDGPVEDRGAGGHYEDVGEGHHEHHRN